MKKGLTVGLIVVFGSIAALGVLVVILLSMLVFLAPDRNVETNVQSAITNEVRELDANLIESMVNQERAKLELEPLLHNEKLKQSACLKLNHMVTFNYWAHDAPDGTEPWYFFNQAGYSYREASENQAYGQDTEQGLVDGWMQSTGHKDNIVKPILLEHGVCSKKVDFQGSLTTVTVHHFGTPR